MNSSPIGARRRRFVLESPIEEPDGFGGSLRRYVAGPLLWGAITPLGATERAGGGRADRRATHRIRLAYRDGVAPPMRLSAGPRRFAIRLAGDPDGRRRDLLCEVEELVEATSEPRP
ncbi:head-tail adaptor protein [Methylobacterium sp. Leaf399]|uniref:head-tail adaptor protein n=1 Tax=Methylobacterium sp. Leaf399 TaxID=1736364 RepID=UPI0006F59C92|nr:head-tail adaptor protein [Methylobacterium sp. Leaf399]KQT19996.1 head-tail adaptor protein [Methylobacterium sp. Leaf399]